MNDLLLEESKRFDEALGEGIFSPASVYAKSQFKSFLRASNLRLLEKVREEMGTIVNTKFPVGERKWCIQCVHRIKTALLTALTTEV